MMARWHKIDSDKDKLLKKAIDLHGHIGPYLILGLVMGRKALRTLDLGGYIGFRAEVFCGTKPPLTAIVDGLQASTGLTTGKMNITISEGDSGKTVFTTEEGDKLILMPKREILVLCGKTGKDREVEVSEELYYNTDEDELIVEIV